MRRLLPCVLVVVALILNGCARRGPDRAFESPYAPGETRRIDSLDQLYALLRERTPEHKLYSVKTQVTMQAPDERRKLRFDANVYHRVPDAIRVRGAHPLAGLLFELIVDGERASVYVKDQKALYEGTLTELQRQGGAIGALPPDRLIGALLVNQALRDELAAGGKWKVLLEPEFLFLVREQPNGRTQTWRVGRADGLVRDVALVDARGRREVAIMYDEYEIAEGGQPLPRDMRVEVGDEDEPLRVRLEVGEYKFDPPMNPAAVTMEPSRVDVRLPLSALANQDSIFPEEQ